MCSGLHSSVQFQGGKNNSDRSSFHSIMADGEEQFYSTMLDIFPVNCFENDSCKDMCMTHGSIEIIQKNIQ